MDTEDPGAPGQDPADQPPTGDSRVDDAVAALGRLAGKPPEEHVAVLEEVHGRLRDILGEITEKDDPNDPSDPR
ncbi:MAG: hypothetical protein JO132_02330 [Streptosporangiaceae bacterium]|nr:hypothetical protein [Streptosporangiaceae bacterium]